jgi:L-glyceraldehyde 3-phosphate reductase
MGGRRVGCIAFSPLAQGMLTDRYLKGIPKGSRAAREVFLKLADLTDERLQLIKNLNDMASQRNQSLAQMALAWLLKDKRVTSVLIGASSVAQLDNNIDCLHNTDFSNDELRSIEMILAQQ